jgi:hypothetical protein
MSDFPSLEIHTSDRVLYRRCRRRWNWSSRIRENLVPVDSQASPALWLGSGVHFGLEDYHGYNRFGDPRDALIAYHKAWKKSELPPDDDVWLELGVVMLQHYVERWLPQHGHIGQTLWIDGEPQVEVVVQVPLGMWIWLPADREDPSYGTVVYEEPRYEEGWFEIVYDMTFDRVLLDDHDRIIVEDYKTAAKEFDTARLELDSQVGSYLWGGALLYGRAIEGACWTQFIKAVPQPLRWLEKKQRFSVDKSQRTTLSMAREQLVEHYGKGKVPDFYTDFLNELAADETPEGDRFIKRSVIYRNEANAASEERKLYQEIGEMLRAFRPADHPNALPLYNNPTRDCSWDCAFRAPCIALDDGSDADSILSEDYEQWEGIKDDWRDRIRWPKAA